MDIEQLINQLIAVCKENNMINSKKISDGRHTFEELYEHRIILFSIICNQNADVSWKSKKHFDEEHDPMFNDSFIAGITTSLGNVTYHIKMKYWDLFRVKEIPNAFEYDGTTPSEGLKILVKEFEEKK